MERAVPAFREKVIGVKVRPSVKVLLTVLGIGGVCWGSWNLFAESQVNSFEYTVVKPKSVNLVAISPSSGFRIVVANSLAQLVLGGSESFGAPADRDEGDSSGQPRIRMPIKDLLESLAGDDAALGRLTMALNRINAEDLPPNPVIWTRERVEQAVAQDGPERKELERDLNLTLTGEPIATLRESTLENGIVLDFPVELNVGENSREARVQEPFRASFVTRVADAYLKNPNLNDDVIRSTYAEEARRLVQGEVPKEALGDVMKLRWSESRTKSLAELPEKVLNGTEVVVNDDHLVNARMETITAANGQKSYALHITLTDLGRKRLWKYSRRNPGFQLLLAVDGVAVAAPTIRRESMTHQITIAPLTDERMTLKAVESINALKNQDKK